MNNSLFKKYRLTYSYTLCLYIILQIGLLSSALAQSNSLSGHDGPYLIYKDGQASILRVQAGKLIEDAHLSEPFSVFTHDGGHQFELLRHSIEKPQDTYQQRGDIMVLSDPHGDFESFYSLLCAHKVVGDQYQWTFGHNHLVIIGDVFDRGKDVLPIYWLLYKLESEARSQGGSLHFLLGNHEEMVLRGDLRYAEDKYIDLSKELGVEYQDLWDNHSELGLWVRTRNTIEKIGNHLFVHAGLSKEIADQGWTISAINDSTRRYIGYTKSEREISTAAQFLYGSKGPLWYRGMVRDDEKYNPLDASDLNRIVAQFGVQNIYVGHTIFPEVTSLYDGVVFAVNVKNKANREEGKSRGLLIKRDKVYIIYDDPNLTVSVKE